MRLVEETFVAEAHVNRRLAAILCADVAGYARLMGDDEERTLAALKAHRRELIDPLLTQHQGRIVKTTGDGILIEFASVIDAVRCAVVIQQGMQDRNASVAQSQRILFRIGINLGDIIIEDGDIFGDGVNVAARLQALTQPGEIYVSGSVREQIGEKLRVGFVDMGEHNVKNIARPIHVYRIEKRGEAAAVVTAKVEQQLALPDRPSIAVLPFRNMSGDPDQEYFCDGMVEDIITGLSRIKSLFVIARNSSFTYKGRAIDVKQTGRELGVRYILEGSIRKAGSRVRITSQLVEAETGGHLWAERYDRPLDDILAVQDEIALSVVGAIEPSLRQAEIERVKRKRPDSLDAYDLVLRALPHVFIAMPKEAAEAIPLLQKALALEPDYAGAHGLLAWCHEILFVRGGFSDENRAGAVRHGHAAIAHGRDDATALALGAFVIAMVEHDRVTAFEAFEQALALSPSCSFALFSGCVALAWGGEADRAIEWAKCALRISPFDRLNHLAYHGLAVGHFLRGRYEEAADAGRRSVQSNPGFSVSHCLLAAPLAKLGRTEEAKAVAKRVLELQPSFSAGGFCAALALPTLLAKPMTEAWCAAGLPP